MNCRRSTGGYLIGAVRVGDSRKCLQGRSDGVGQDESTGGWTLLLCLPEEGAESADGGTNGRRKRKKEIRLLCFVTASSPCPTPGRIPAVGRMAPDSFGSSSPSAEMCPSESEEQEVKSDSWRSGSGLKRRCVQEHQYLLDLGLHGGGDGCWRDKLECGCGIVGILSRKLHHQVDLMAAEVSRHHATAVHSIHLQHTNTCVMSLPV